MAEETLTVLAVYAAEVSHPMFAAFKPKDLSYYQAACDIGTRLHLINSYLDSIPPHWVDLDIENLCRTIVRCLETIIQLTREATLKTIVVFIREQQDKAQTLKSACDSLLRKVNGHKEAEAPPGAAAPQHPDTTSTLDSDSVFKVFELISKCDTIVRMPTGPTKTDEPSQPNELCNIVSASEQGRLAVWHPTRLSLHEPEPGRDSTSGGTVVLVSDISMGYWQEFCLKMSTQSESLVDDDRQLVGRGCFCPILERKLTARVFLSFQDDRSLSLLKSSADLDHILQAGAGESLKSVLRHYNLTSKDKVILSYAIARSYWKYYDSDFMRTRWTSDTIWFMPEEGRKGVHKDRLPLLAYLPFPFGTASSSSDDEDDMASDIRHEDLRNHRCPRIFDIGVLLLEIGLARPFQTGHRRDRVAQANLDHKIAKDDLRELQETEWDGFTASKKHFDWAIQYCLDGANFVSTTIQPPYLTPKQAQKRAMGPTKPAATASDSRAEIHKRRRMFYEKVVGPLARLAKTGFHAKTGDMTYANKKSAPEPEPFPQRISTVMGAEIESGAVFNSVVVPKMWLQNLKRISGLVEQKRRQYGVTTAVRIALLDTGLDLEFPGFHTKTGLIRRITEAADFVEPNSPGMTDAFGHGTFMARLVMECAPAAEVVVARVAKDTQSLEGSQSAVSKAILWAGRTAGADIISMSFGFPRDSRQISDAIRTIQRERDGNIIFLASAGNSSSDEESFPARHPDVMSVCATDYEGVFRSAPSTTASGAVMLGTFGYDIPHNIREEFRAKYEHACQPGSSVATAIMAGISATMLLYAPALPFLVPLKESSASSSSRNLLKHIHSAKGMEAVLLAMSKAGTDVRRHRAVDPIVFWKTHPTELSRSSAIFVALSAVDRKADISAPREN